MRDSVAAIPDGVYRYQTVTDGFDAPILLALAVVMMISGLLVSTYQIIVGGLLTLFFMYRFAMEHHRPHEEHGH